MHPICAGAITDRGLCCEFSICDRARVSGTPAEDVCMCPPIRRTDAPPALLTGSHKPRIRLFGSLCKLLAVSAGRAGRVIGNGEPPRPDAVTPAPQISYTSWLARTPSRPWGRIGPARWRSMKPYSFTWLGRQPDSGHPGMASSAAAASISGHGIDNWSSALA